MYRNNKSFEVTHVGRSCSRRTAGCRVPPEVAPAAAAEEHTSRSSVARIPPTSSSRKEPPSHRNRRHLLAIETCRLLKWPALLITVVLPRLRNEMATRRMGMELVPRLRHSNTETAQALRLIFQSLHQPVLQAAQAWRLMCLCKRTRTAKAERLTFRVLQYI